MTEKILKIALVGNPNSGKTSLFNQLTGLNQKTGNFPGVTVDKKTGTFTLQNTTVHITDLPGTYSIYPRSIDETVVTHVLTDVQNLEYPDLILFIADASNLKRNLLLFSQLYDIGIPVIMAINMLDTLADKGIKINIPKLKESLGVNILSVNAREGEGIKELKEALIRFEKKNHTQPFFPEHVHPLYAHKKELSEITGQQHSGFNYYLAQTTDINKLDNAKKKQIVDFLAKTDFDKNKWQQEETITRYKETDKRLAEVMDRSKASETADLSKKIDKILTHKIGGYAIFLLVLFLIFQAIFAWSSVPMDLIDTAFSSLNNYLKEVMPAGIFTDLFTDGIVAGLGGVVIFIPQIAFLFGFISLLEETGYMSRVVYMMDKIMRKFGLNGKSVVPLISGVACAVPSIMATRTIENWKDRIITIFVTPLMSCSARLPVYTLIIALIIPPTSWMGIINVQGIVLMGLYLMGFMAAILTALAMKYIVQVKEQSYFIMEMPVYRMPRMANIGLTILEKVKTFVFEAGKIIVAISIVLWVLSNFGTGNSMEEAEKNVRQTQTQLSEEELTTRISSEKLKASYAGNIGKLIEPVIAPIGFDWRIGISLVTSFAAREVFVGTMATIYSIAGEDELTLKEKMANDKRADGTPFYTMAMGMSLLMFYAFAMQCMSTFAVVYRETKSWKWPVIQTVYLTVLAWCSSWLVYQLFS